MYGIPNYLCCLTKFQEFGICKSNIVLSSDVDPDPDSFGSVDPDPEV